ncbi:MAG: helix-turn-helix domain-containing protein [Brasilonema octagenarum HA4186-MV1]|jgi:YesN/AraC family two-component response regulator|nr:helix-turn-helix domain-containing protein [Brasilonema octagenarum HA4186-MV1]
MKKILVIENVAATRNLFLEGIKAKGFQTIGADNGVIGVHLAHKELPDLIISDIILPRLDGYSLLRVLRQNPTTAIIPLIFVTAKATRDDIRKGMELGVDDYLTKPCTVDELLKAIAARLERQATLQQCYSAQCQLIAKPLSANIKKSSHPKSVFLSNPQLSEVFRFIETNFHRAITLADVAQEVGYSPAYLTNLVRRQTGQTVQSWIIQRRMEAACSLLLETSERVEQIAAKVGYKCPVNFFRQFRQHYGTTPHAWRKEYRSYCTFADF